MILLLLAHRPFNCLVSIFVHGKSISYLLIQFHDKRGASEFSTMFYVPNDRSENSLNLVNMIASPHFDYNRNLL